MSNKKSNLQELGSNDFLNHIKNDKELDFNFFNKLLAIHILSILHNTTGVSEAGFYFNYSYQDDDSKSTRVYELLNSYFLYNTKNQLIENSNRSSRGSCNFTNNIFCFRQNHLLNAFISKYLNDNKRNCMRKIENNTIIQNTNTSINLKVEPIKFRIKQPAKRFSEESQNEGYKNIIKDKACLSYIEKYLLSKELKNNNNSIKRLKV